MLLFLTLSHTSPSQSLLSAAIAELPADDASRQQVPAVIAHCSPLVVFQYLHATFANPRASLQPHVALENKQAQ